MAKPMPVRLTEKLPKTNAKNRPPSPPASGMKGTGSGTTPAAEAAKSRTAAKPPRPK
jgi:hypothetical protein